MEIDRSAFSVNQADCPNCQVKMGKLVNTKPLFDGTITFHIIEFQCPKCKRKYLDLEQAEKYDLYATLEKLSKESNPLEILNHCLANGKVTA